LKEESSQSNDEHVIERRKRMSSILKRYGTNNVEKLRRRILHYYEFLQMKHEMRSEKNFFSYFLNTIDFPLHLLRQYTIPPGD
jgi:hypothetical protein